MQLLYESSEEGKTACLGIIPGRIMHLKQDPTMIVPHMGWNQLRFSQKKSPLLKGIKNKSYFYYVHSYAAPVTENTLAETEYGTSFAAAVQYKNFFGVQFHPERSGKVGEQLLKNFLRIKK